MSGLTKTPLCGLSFPDGQCIDGWVTTVDDEARIVRRCLCRTQTAPTPRQAKAAALKATADAHESAMKAALLIIKDVAEGLPLISGNDTRELFVTAGVEEQLAGPAFGRAVRLGWLEPEDFVQSTGESAKGAYLRRYTSKLFGHAVVAAGSEAS